MISVRRYEARDAEQCFDVFYRAVHEGAKARYSPRQRQAWAPTDQPPEGWQARLGDVLTWVAEADGRVVGFMNLEPDGHLDMAFVAPDWMGRGVADALWTTLLTEAQRLGLTRLTTEASHLARPFFLRHGWRVEAPEEVERHGVRLQRFRMFRPL